MLQILINIFAFFMRYFLIMINGCLIQADRLYDLVLPEGFFYDFVFRIGGFFVGSLVVLGGVSAACIFIEKRKKKN